MKREDANEITKELLKLYEDKLEKPDPGKKCQECFDVKKANSAQDYLEVYEKAAKKLEDFGVKI